MSKTVLQQAIEQINNYASQHEGIRPLMAISILSELLPAEKQQIVEAYQTGYDFSTNTAYDDADQYYSETFLNQQKEQS